MIDTHCHLNDRERVSDPAAWIAEARDAGVDRIIVVGIDAEWSRIALELADAHEGVYAVVGWHPTSSPGFGPGAARELREMARRPKAVAIGEIGLDYYWDTASPEQQFRALDAQMDLAEELATPVVFHCRDAWPQLLDYLERRGPSVPMLFHCFSGDAGVARRAVDLGGYFGVDGPITYPKANELREIVASLPNERIVVETDAPWLAPHPHRGKPNRPAYLPLIVDRLAEVLGMPPAACAELTTANAARFFRLP